MKRLSIAAALLSIAVCTAHATDVEDWSTTDASNNAPPPAGAPEAMAPSAVNDVMRTMMGAIKRQFYDQNGSITTGGSGNAYTATVNTTPSALATGQMYVLEANHTNTGASTLQINALAATAIVLPDGTALQGGEIVAGGIYAFIYDGTSYQLTSNVNELPDKLYFGAAEAAGTETDGITVRDTTSTAPAIDFYTNAAARTATISADPSNGVQIIGRSLGAPVEIKAERAGGGSRNVLRGDPDTFTELLDEGVTVLKTRDDGFTTQGDATQTVIEFADVTAVQQGYIRVDATTGDLGIKSKNPNGGRVQLKSDNSAGTEVWLLDGDPDAELLLYHAGDSKARTQTDANGALEVNPGPGWLRVATSEIAYKTVTETVTSSTALQNDDALTLSIPAAGHWAFELRFRVSAASSTPDFKFAFNTDANMSNDSYTYSYGADNDSINGVRGVSGIDDVEIVDFSSGLTDHAFTIQGVLEISAAGTLTLRWAQNTSSGSAVGLQAGGMMKLEYLGAL